MLSNSKQCKAQHKHSTSKAKAKQKQCSESFRELQRASESFRELQRAPIGVTPKQKQSKSKLKAPPTSPSSWNTINFPKWIAGGKKKHFSATPWRKTHLFATQIACDSLLSPFLKGFGGKRKSAHFAPFCVELVRITLCIHNKVAITTCMSADVDSIRAFSARI